MAYDLEGLRQVLERNALPRCLACGEAEWAIVEMVVVLQKVDPDQPTTKAEGLPALPAVCGYCGYIRLHSIPLLEKIALREP